MNRSVDSCGILNSLKGVKGDGLWVMGDWLWVKDEGFFDFVNICEL